MNLRPEERLVGRENFYEAAGETRRDFLIKGIGAGLVSGAGLGSIYFGYGAEVDNPVRIGIIGTGDEGNVLIGALTPKYVQVVAIADIRPYNVHRAFHGDHSSEGTLKVRPGLMKKYGWSTEEEARKHVKVYTDNFEELLANPDVEGVIIALPLHLHDVAAIKAMRAGKHVLTEKLMGHSVRQCKEMGRVAKQTGKLLATGHQRHYSILYDNAVHAIKQGLLGDIHHVRAQWHRSNLPGKDSWAAPLPPPSGTDIQSEEMAKAYPMIADYQKAKAAFDKAKDAAAAVQEKLAKRLKQFEKQLEDQLLDAAKYGYEEKVLADRKGTKRSPMEELIRWRLWNRTGGGLMAELGSHQLDASSIFVSSQRDDGQKVLPLSVAAVGGRHLFPVDRDADDHVYCTYEFPGKGYYKDFATGEVDDENKKIVVTYSSINGNGFGGYGEVVLGTSGTLILDREEEVLLFAGSPTGKVALKKNKDGILSLDTTIPPSATGAALGKLALGGKISRGYTEEIEHWAWCIRNPDPANLPKCHPKVAMADAIIALTSNQSMAEKRRIEFKREWFDIDSDETPDGTKPRKAEEIS